LAVAPKKSASGIGHVGKENDNVEKQKLAYTAEWVQKSFIYLFI
jgi:hypothetical protein